MRVLKQPAVLAHKGIKWPKIMVLENREKPPIGMPYIRACSDEEDDLLIYRLLIPMLCKKYSQYNWKAMYRNIANKNFHNLPVQYWDPENGLGELTNLFTNDGNITNGRCRETLLELASDLTTSVNLDVIMAMKLMPTWMEDIADAVRINVTNSFAWTDGYNKKTGICSGYLTRAKDKRVLMIVDISSSIPEGVSAGLLTLMTTMVDITKADLIVTGGKSYFWEHQDAINLDKNEVRAMIPRSNESYMFNEILNTIDLDYDIVICFGDSDTPHINEDVEERLKNAPKIKKLMSYFIGNYDRYGGSHKAGAGYSRWIKDINNPNVQIEHYTDWVEVFK